MEFLTSSAFRVAARLLGFRDAPIGAMIILSENNPLAAMFSLGGPNPATHHGIHSSFTEVYCEPKPWRSTRPVM